MEEDFGFLSVEMVEPTNSQLEELELTPFVNDDALPPPPSDQPHQSIQTPTEPESSSSSSSRRRDKGKLRVVGDSSELGGGGGEGEEPARPNALQVIKQLERDAIRILLLRTPLRRKGLVPLPRPRWQRPAGYRRRNKEKDSAAA